MIEIGTEIDKYMMKAGVPDGFESKRGGQAVKKALLVLEKSNFSFH